jgi:hypothetical protein
VVYHASTIRYTFTRPGLVGELIPTLVDEIIAYKDKRSSGEWMLESLFRFIERPATVKSNALYPIEQGWTGRKNSVESTNSGEDIFAFLRYRTYFGYNHWEITRDLICITCRNTADLELLLKCILQRFTFGDIPKPSLDLSRLEQLPDTCLIRTICRIRD